MKLNGTEVNLEALVNDGIAQAETFVLGRVDQERIDREPLERQPMLRRLLVVRRVVRDATGYEPRLDELDADNLLGSVVAQVVVYNKRAGLRSLTRKMGKAGAERYVSEKAGRHISLR